MEWDQLLNNSAGPGLSREKLVELIKDANSIVQEAFNELDSDSIVKSQLVLMLTMTLISEEKTKEINEQQKKQRATGPGLGIVGGAIMGAGPLSQMLDMENHFTHCPYITTMEKDDYDLWGGNCSVISKGCETLQSALSRPTNCNHYRAQYVRDELARREQK